MAKKKREEVEENTGWYSNPGSWKEMSLLDAIRQRSKVY